MPRTREEILKTLREQDANFDHRRNLRGLMNNVGYYSNELDMYASQLFERPIRGSWAIFDHMAKIGCPSLGNPYSNDPWFWNELTGCPHYPSEKIDKFELFASIYLHEVAHGWCYLLRDYELGERRHAQTGHFWVYADDRNEEDICWEISRLVCHLLDISFDEEAIP